MKEYALVAVWKKDPDAEPFEATRLARGPAAELRVEIPLLPPNTIRLCVVENKKFEKLAQLTREQVDRLLVGTPLSPQAADQRSPSPQDHDQSHRPPSEHSQSSTASRVESENELPQTVEPSTNLTP